MNGLLSRLEVGLVEMTPEEIISDGERREKVREKLKYICIAFDGDHPQIVATEKFLIPRSIAKNQDGQGEQKFKITAI